MIDERDAAVLAAIRPGLCNLSRVSSGIRGALVSHATIQARLRELSNGGSYLVHADTPASRRHERERDPWLPTLYESTYRLTALGDRALEEWRTENERDPEWPRRGSGRLSPGAKPTNTRASGARQGAGAGALSPPQGRGSRGRR